MTAPDKITFAPQVISSQAVAVVEARAAAPNAGILTGIPPVDKVLNKHRPGELRVILGFTSNYKSGLMSFISRFNAKKLTEEQSNKVIITVTWEQSIEEQGILDMSQISRIDITRMVRGELSDGEWVQLKAAAIQRGKLPWWLIGHSSESNERRPRLTMTEVASAMAYMVDVQGIEPALISLDYLQRIRREGGAEPRMQFMEIVDRAKDMALAFHCPVMLGSQAKRDVKERKWRLPQADDGQETSNLEQSADSLLSVWMPKNDYPPPAWK